MLLFVVVLNGILYLKVDLFKILVIFIIFFLLVIICEVLIILIIFLNIFFEMSFLLEKREMFLFYLYEDK